MAIAAAYDPRIEYVARRHITVAGKTYQQGDVVPRKGVPEHEYHTMFARRKIVLPSQGAAAPARANSADKGEEIEPITAPEGGIRPKAKGWFAVFHGGVLVRNVRGEEAANALLAELRGEAVAPPHQAAPETPQDEPGESDEAPAPAPAPEAPEAPAPLEEVIDTPVDAAHPGKGE